MLGCRELREGGGRKKGKGGGERLGEGLEVGTSRAFGGLRDGGELGYGGSRVRDRW